MTGYQITVEKVVDGVTVENPTRNFIPFNFKVPQEKTDGCENQNDCDGSDEHKGKTIDITA